MSEFTDVVAFGELAPGVPRSFEVEGRSIVLVLWQDSVLAVRNICPHQSTPLERGSVRPKVLCGDRIGEMRHDSAMPLIVCPWHAWTFDLQTGQCAVDKKLRIKVYATRVDEGRVLVAVRA